MRTVQFSAGMLVSCVLTFAAVAVQGQNYPVRPIRIICSEVGASNDFLSRVIAQTISEPLGQQVIVDNRASAVVPGMVARAAPDGYTLMVITSFLWVLPLMQSVPYDVVTDFTPITLAVSSPSVIVVHPSVPARSIKELIALAKARPGELNYGSGATGSASHLALELIKAMAGINIVRVPYNGAGAAITALIGGQIQLLAATSSSITSHIKSGRVRALAVTSAQPSPLFPGVPTVAASGLPGYEFSALNLVFAPINTPAAIINRLHDEIVKGLNRADIKEKLFNTGMEVIGSSPAQTAAMMKADIAKIGKLIKDTGIHTD